MKKVLLVAALMAMFIGCSSESGSKEGSTTTGSTNGGTVSNGECNEYYNESSIQKLFVNASDITVKRQDKSYCSYSFIENSEEYRTYLSIGLLGGANESFLEQSTSRFDDKEEISGLGDKAYIYTLAGSSKQITVLSNGNLFHVGVETENGFVFDEDKTTQAIKDILSKM